MRANRFKALPGCAALGRAGTRVDRAGRRLLLHRAIHRAGRARPRPDARALVDRPSRSRRNLRSGWERAATAQAVYCPPAKSLETGTARFAKLDSSNSARIAAFSSCCRSRRLTRLRTSPACSPARARLLVASGWLSARAASCSRGRASSGRHAAMRCAATDNTGSGTPGMLSASPKLSTTCCSIVAPEGNIVPNCPTLQGKRARQRRA